MPARHYRIEVVGRLPAAAGQEFPGMSIEASGATTILSGIVADAAALYGIIARLEALGVALLAAQPSPQNRG